MSTELERRLERLDGLIDQLDAGVDPASRAAAQELVQVVMDLHGSALERIVHLLRQSGAPGEGLLDRLAQDGLVRSVLLLHDLHPVAVETRVHNALRSHGGKVEVLAVDAASVHVRVDGPLTLGRAVEQALRDAAPDVPSIVVDRSEPLVVLERRR
jgi:Fe-S cluster biogenesis protein NfuA